MQVAFYRPSHNEPNEYVIKKSAGTKNIHPQI